MTSNFRFSKTRLNEIFLAFLMNFNPLASLTMLNETFFLWFSNTVPSNQIFPLEKEIFLVFLINGNLLSISAIVVSSGIWFPPRFGIIDHVNLELWQSPRITIIQFQRILKKDRLWRGSFFDDRVTRSSWEKSASWRCYWKAR